MKTHSSFIHAYLDEPLRIGAFCRDIGCDWKRLERAFQSINGVASKRFLTLARLSRARRLLHRATPNDSITSIAGDCEIHYFGCFSYEYRRVFGELPRETLARAARRA